MDKIKIAKITFSILFMLLIASPLSAFAQSNTNKLYGGALRIAYLRDPISFNGVLNFWSTTSYYDADMFNRLLTFDANYNLKGDLAQTWEHSVDGKTWTFHLYKNVKWHDGVPFTSADVKWHFTMLTN
jgi:peptide/nickel transport system substrate-binding protein